MTSSKPPKTYSYRNIGRLGQWVGWLLLIDLAMSVVGCVSDLMELNLLKQISAIAEGTDTSGAETLATMAEQNDLRQMIIGGIQIVVAVIGFILFLRWVYLAACNCHAISKQQLKITPGWSVGWYFVPIMNIWKPFLAMRQIWNVSDSPPKDPEAPAAGLVIGWWLLFLASNSAGSHAFRMSTKAEDISTLLIANLDMLIADIIAIAATCFACLLVGRITRMQSSMAAPSQAPLTAVVDPA